jgi:hypothetical protein
MHHLFLLLHWGYIPTLINSFRSCVLSFKEVNHLYHGTEQF